MDTEDKASPADEGRRSSEGLGLEPERDNLHWHALNYRTAHPLHAEVMWRELVACVERMVADAVAAERLRCAQCVRGESARHSGRIEAVLDQLAQRMAEA